MSCMAYYRTLGIMREARCQVNKGFGVVSDLVLGCKWLLIGQLVELGRSEFMFCIVTMIFLYLSKRRKQKHRHNRSHIIQPIVHDYLQLC